MTCENVLFSNTYGVVLNQCHVGNVEEKKSCFASYYINGNTNDSYGFRVVLSIHRSNELAKERIILLFTSEHAIKNKIEKLSFSAISKQL